MYKNIALRMAELHLKLYLGVLLIFIAGIIEFKFLNLFLESFKVVPT